MRSHFSSPRGWVPIHRVVTAGGDGSGEPLVLVADDDEDIRELVAFRLGAAGYKVVTACDGEEALQLALDQQPDLAVLDVMMPRLTGIEVTERIRASDSETRNVPIVLLTARVQEAD